MWKKGRKKERKKPVTQQGLNQSEAKIRRLTKADREISECNFEPDLMCYSCMNVEFLCGNPRGIKLLFIQECIASSIVATNLIVSKIPNRSVPKLMDMFTSQLNNILPYSCLIISLCLSGKLFSPVASFFNFFCLFYYLVLLWFFL